MAGELYWERKHGDAGDALDFACGHCRPDEALAFLEDWRAGLAEEWPAYMRWLKVQHDAAKSARGGSTPKLLVLFAILVLIPCATAKEPEPSTAIVEASNGLYNADLLKYDCTYNRSWAWLNCDAVKS